MSVENLQDKSEVTNREVEKRKGWKQFLTRFLLAASLLYLFEDQVVTVELDGSHFRLGGESCGDVVILDHLGDGSLVQQTKPMLGFDKDEPSNPDSIGVVYQSCGLDWRDESGHVNVLVNSFVVLFQDDYGSKFLRVDLFNLEGKMIRLRLQERFIKAIYGLGDHRGDAQTIIPVLIEADLKSLSEGVRAFRYLGFYVNRHGKWVFLRPEEVVCYGTNPVFVMSWGKHTPYQSTEACEKTFLNLGEGTPFSSERCRPSEVVSIDLPPESDMGCGDKLEDPFTKLPLSDLFPGESLENKSFCGGGSVNQRC